MEILRCDHLEKRFGELRAIDDLSFGVNEGEFLSILGPSGCGKTTVLRLMSGLENPTEGRITFRGRAVDRTISDIGFVFQESALFPWRNVKENIGFPLEMKGINGEERERTESRYVDLVHLNGFENAFPHQLSGGMKQRASLARALAAEPEVLLMDEPFASLDALSREKMQEELFSIWEKERDETEQSSVYPGIDKGSAVKTFVLVTHSVDEALYLSDRIIILTKRPARIKMIFDNPAERPRDRESEELLRIKRNIMEELKEETA